MKLNRLQLLFLGVCGASSTLFTSDLHADGSILPRPDQSSTVAAFTEVEPTPQLPVIKLSWLLPQSANDSVNVLTLTLLTSVGTPWTEQMPITSFRSSCVDQNLSAWLEGSYVDGHQISQAYLATGCQVQDTVQVSLRWENQSSEHQIQLPLTGPALSAKAKLGQKLFFEKRLSSSGVQSCASCHQPANRYSSVAAAATEAGGNFMQHSGFRNTPSAAYAALIPRFGFLGVTNQQGSVDNVANGKLGTPRRGQLWDGRAALITTQPVGPLLSPFEMAHKDAESVLRALLASPQSALYRQVYGKLSSRSDPQVVLDNIASAIGSFETEDRSFAPFNSKFDAVVAGKAVFSEQEASGLALFNNPAKGACLGCHDSTGLSVDSPQLFSDLSYRVLAVPRNYQIVYNNDALAGTALDSLGVASLRNGAKIATGQHEFYDLGFCGPFRTDSLFDPTLCGAFRAAPLRNVALRKHYFHNGVFSQISDVIRFYVQRDIEPGLIYQTIAGGSDVAYNDLPSEYHGNIVRNRSPFTPAANGKPRLSPTEINDIVAFLCSLNDGYDPTSPETYRQSQECIASKR